MRINLQEMEWISPPKRFHIGENSVSIRTEPFTDLWQRTYYGFRNDNAPMLQMRTKETYFSFVVRTEFVCGRRYDQCGIVLYMDSDNWLKASVEYENAQTARLGSVVTQQGYSDWASFDIAAGQTQMWYRLSRRESDFRIEYSPDGKDYRQMRICHLHAGGGEIRFGIYACSPEDASFTANFYDVELLPCVWEAHQ